MAHLDSLLGYVVCKLEVMLVVLCDTLDDATTVDIPARGVNNGRSSLLSTVDL